MTKRMLIDASHPEETRVVVAENNRVSEFDYEIEDKKPLKGNIYLAKVTRVEPSLQAAFVEYGGNRHGFLPFSEIHPDYYRLPIADREALIAEEREAQQAAAADGDAEMAGSDSAEPDAEAEAAAAGAKQRSHADGESAEDPADGDGPPPTVEQVETAKSVETLADDDLEEAARRRAAILGRYKIQEVIKRRQVILVQVVKEERGTKGAALSTYLSLAGRYCVLMPNTDKGGGVSRKISSAKDRKRLKTILADMKIPEGMAVIVRTAGSERTKTEIRRDYDYLIRLWDQIRETTLQSTAPSLIHEEANLIKRSIRDLYTRDMDEVLVQGETGYKIAKSFMRSLMPSHAKKVQRYAEEKLPVFHRFQIEQQLDNIHSPSVQLKSGGYIVINQTEALVAIDVNSGKSTKERHIEETALKTNLEAADEVARQLKLRDMAGLVVIDFIDMDAPKNNKEVEQRLKEAMRQDRARIQLGRISPFGLLELSRQRLRPSVQETSTEVCHTCGGSGFVRSPESTALHIMRALEEEGVRRGGGELRLTVPAPIAMYILNEKRGRLQDVEQRYGFRVRIETDNSLIPPAHRLDRISTIAAEEVKAETAEPAEAEDTQPAEEKADGDGASKSKRGRRGGRKKRKTAAEEAAGAEDTAQAEPADDEAEAEDAAQAADGEAAEAGAESEDDEDKQAARKRRRGKRGGRRRSKRRDEMSAEGDAEEPSESSDQSDGGGAEEREPESEPESETESETESESGGGAAEGEPALAQAESGSEAPAAKETGKGRSSRGARKRSSRGRSRIAAAAEQTAEQAAAQARENGRADEAEAASDTGEGESGGAVQTDEAEAPLKRRAKSTRSRGTGSRRKSKTAEPTETGETLETGEAAGVAASEGGDAVTPSSAEEVAPAEEAASSQEAMPAEEAAPAEAHVTEAASAGQGEVGAPLAETSSTTVEADTPEAAAAPESAEPAPAGTVTAAPEEEAAASASAEAPTAATAAPVLTPEPAAAPESEATEAPYGEAAQPTGEDTLVKSEDDTSKTKRRGWWQKLLG